MGLEGLVTLEDLEGLLDSTHPRGFWRRGFGREVVEDIVGVWNKYTVTTSSPSGAESIQEALQHTNGLLIKFTEGVDWTILPNTFTGRFDKFIDGRGAHIRFDGPGTITIAQGFHDGAKFGWCNVEWWNGNSAGNDCLDVSASNVAGTGYILGMWGGLRDGYDECMNITQAPQGGFLFSLTGVFNQAESHAAASDFGLIFGNNPDPTSAANISQHTRNARMRATLIANNFTTRLRHPAANSMHLEMLANRHRVRLYAMHFRHSNLIARVRNPIFVGPPENPTNNFSIQLTSGNAGGTVSSGLPSVRVENARYRDPDAADIRLADENNRAAVTDASIYEDEFGVSQATYNDIADLVAMFDAMTDDEIDAWVQEFAGWFDVIDLTGDVSLTAGAIEGGVINLVNRVDNWPALTSMQKTALLDAAYSTGTKWAEIRAFLSASDVSISGKTLTITFPVGTNAVTLATDEEVRFTIHPAWMARSVYTEPETALALLSGTGGGGGGGDPDETVVTIDADYSSVIRFDSATSTYLSPAPDPDNIRIGTTAELFANPQRGTFRWPVSSLPDSVILTKAEAIFFVNELTGNSGQFYNLTPYNLNGLANPDADTPADEFSKAGTGVAPTVQSTVFRTLGQAIIELPIDEWGPLIEAAIAANGTFSIGIKQLLEDTRNIKTRVNAHTLTNPPRLRLTYIAAPVPPDPYSPEMARYITLQAQTGVL